MTKASVDAWLRSYVAAWETYDPDSVAALFSEDASYRYHPFDELIQGRLAIVASWVDDRDPAGTYDASYRTVAIDGDLAVATGRSRYYTDTTKSTLESEYENLFLIRFDEAGRCRSFQEWYMPRRTQKEAGGNEPRKLNP